MTTAGAADGGAAATATGGGDPIVLGGLESVLVTSSYCGAPFGCRGGSTALDFATGELTVTRCESVDSGLVDAASTDSGAAFVAMTRTMSQDQLTAVRAGLEGLRTEPQTRNDQDGYMYRLTVRVDGLSNDYDYPSTRCGARTEKDIASGFEDLLKVLPVPSIGP